MIMKRLPILLSLMFGMAILSPIQGLGEESISVQFQIFRVTGTLSGDTSLEEDVWAGSEPPGAELKKAVTIFTRGHFRLGENVLEMKESGWLWNGAPLESDSSLKDISSEGQLTLKGKPSVSVKDNDTFISAEKMEYVASENESESPIRLISAPKILVRSGDAAELQIISKQKIEYFEQREDGLFELKKLQEPTGLKMGIRAEREGQNKIRIKYLTFSLRSVEEREPIPNVTLPVGRPILQSREYKVDIEVTPGKDYGFLLHPGQGQGVLIIRLRLGLVTESLNTQQTTEK
jgi:hypothetical protein